TLSISTYGLGPSSPFVSGGAYCGLNPRKPSPMPSKLVPDDKAAAPVVAVCTTGSAALFAGAGGSCSARAFFVLSLAAGGMSRSGGDTSAWTTVEGSDDFLTLPASVEPIAAGAVKPATTTAVRRPGTN